MEWRFEGAMGEDRVEIELGPGTVISFEGSGVYDFLQLSLENEGISSNRCNIVARADRRDIMLMCQGMDKTPTTY